MHVSHLFKTADVLIDLETIKIKLSGLCCCVDWPDLLISLYISI